MKPLATKLRPQNLNDFYGQEHLLDVFKNIIVNKRLHSMILWGPSGTGKTTLAQIICSNSDAYFVQISAVLDGVKQLREVVENAKKYQNINTQTILFVDEIHRFNKTQQDVFLPHIESGLITLIGATTENPSFECNSALLSRVSVYVLKKLDFNSQLHILNNALQHRKLNISDKIKKQIILSSSGDARKVINFVEKIENTNDNDIIKLLDNSVCDFNKNGDIFYQQLSAFHKSVRGSSPDGALYWMARMLLAGTSSKIIARRLLAIASEDIGNADPRALEIVLNAWNIFERVGEKEGNRAIAQAAIYCAVAPKSNAVYLAFNQAISDAKASANFAVPKHLCNASTQIMQDMEYGKGYKYAHNEKGAFAKNQTYFPKELGEKIYYQPTNYGLEIKISEKLNKLRKQ